jgi:hypothetical protein
MLTQFIKVFKHIKDLGHANPIETNSESAASQATSSKKKNKKKLVIK